MLANGVLELIQESIKSIKLELENIKKNYGENYNSAHEGYAVLLEEVEEVEECLRCIRAYIKILLERIRNNFKDMENSDKSVELLMVVMVVEDAKQLAEEAVQVAAVAEKFVQTMAEKFVQTMDGMKDD